MPPEYNYSSVALETQLAGPIGPSDTVINVEGTTGFPSVPFNVTIDPDGNEEVVTVTAIVGLALTVDREQDGTVALSHQAGKKVRHQAIGRDLQLSRNHEAADSDVHGVESDDTVLGRKQTATVENKTIDGTQNTLQNVPQEAIVDLTDDLSTLVATDAALAAEDEVLDARLEDLEKPPVVQTFTSNGTWFKSDWPGLKAVRVRAVGGGGGGGGAASGTGNACGGCGGAGSYAESIIPASSLGATVAVTVGSGGSGGAAGQNNGSGGGGSSFGSHVTTNGGGGGQGSAVTSGNGGGFGGSGGSPGTGQITSFGGQGSRGRVVGGVVVASGTGGASAFGSGRAYSAPFGAGVDAQAKGSGGSGATASSTNLGGGDGADGVVIVENIF